MSVPLLLEHVAPSVKLDGQKSRHVLTFSYKKNPERHESQYLLVAAFASIIVHVAHPLPQISHSSVNSLNPY